VLVAHCFGEKGPKKTVGTIKGLYEGFQCPVFHDGKLTDFFKVARIRHGYTGCPGRNVKNFRRVFLMLKYTDIT
jgi:hypothetical protein